jgi:hypothetical protein
MKNQEFLLPFQPHRGYPGLQGGKLLPCERLPPAAPIFWLIEALCRVTEFSMTVIFCAVVLFWRCHLRHIAKAMEERRWRVVCVLDEKRLEA